MHCTTYLVGAYGLLLFFGGLIGFATAHSIPSLVMGAVSASILGFLAWGIEKNWQFAHLAATIVTGLLMCFFTYRTIVTMKWVPGIVAGVSLIVFAYLLRSFKD